MSVSDGIEIHPAVESVAAEWDQLALSQGASPFERPGWISAWLAAFGAEGLRVLALRRGGRLTAVVPVLARRGLVRSPTNWHSPMFGPVAADDDARAAILAALHRGRTRRIDLSFLDAETVAAARAGWPMAPSAERGLHSSPYIAIESDWETYWNGLSKNLRSNVRRRRKRLAALGKVEVEVVEGGKEVPALLEHCFRLEAGGWKGERGTAISSSPATVRFYTEVAAWAAGAGLLRLCLLRLDGRVIAFNYSLEDGCRHYLLKLGHEVELGDAGPGTVLTAAMVERAFAEGLDSYEFLGEPDRYKIQWGDRRREVSRIQLFAPGLLGGADRLVQTHGRTVAKLAVERGGRLLSSARR
jgi:CelD/BcsL family acetyltransferase involved in cellulose biosynthesis